MADVLLVPGIALKLTDQKVYSRQKEIFISTTDNYLVEFSLTPGAWLLPQGYLAQCSP